MAKEIDFYDLYWHDAVIKNIYIDRTRPHNTDTIAFQIEWPDDVVNTVIFEGVYWANFVMNFGVLGNEFIYTASILKNDDADIIAFYNKTKEMFGNLELTCYLIETNTTGSKLKILAKGFKIIELS